MIATFIFILFYTIILLYVFLKNIQKIKTDNNIIVTWTNIVTTSFMLGTGITLLIHLIHEF
mgnify:CR=1 FL=1